MPESRPVAVIINDVHYNINTLPLADKVTRQAIVKANELGVPLILAGDLHDTKANLRAECVNAMIETFSQFKTKDLYILRGNHDAINEKSKEHSLNFLAPYAHIIDEFIFTVIGGHTIYFIPYQYDTVILKTYLNSIPEGSTIIMHQGVHGSNSGEYIQDKSAIPTEWLKDFRVISGHYHTKQDIKCGRPRRGAVGVFSYTGNPYTLTFGEANDPPKGFHVLMSDGTLEFIPTNLRKHVVMEVVVDSSNLIADENFKRIKKDDLVWVKVKGTKEDLAKLNKTYILKHFGLPSSTRLELLPLDTNSEVQPKKSLSQTDSLDAIIETLINTSSDQKERLKTLWRGLCE